MVGREDAPRIVAVQEWRGLDFGIKNHALKISQLGSGVGALIPVQVFFVLMHIMCCFVGGELSY